MFILHLALGGCLKAPPVDFGITADTGGHIAYVLDAAIAQAEGGAQVSIVTRLFHEDHLPPVHALPHEIVGGRNSIDRQAIADDLMRQRMDGG
ncbi:MAG: HAD family hydrolase, partial [Sphingomonas sp.]